ncbi:hypothetical protein BDN72DRAFT_906686 [Pluteus cervinus]|uniref:Uncharacterized protein n=1 Tax=Pluteus cervinus TaxID=181527 RepID=A0ACD2ZYR9_9AGAR|nr:hypothetical protein BDN72DRAFT_906686 [Pluteus cervinus]
MDFAEPFMVASSVIDEDEDIVGDPPPQGGIKRPRALSDMSSSATSPSKPAKKLARHTLDTPSPSPSSARFTSVELGPPPPANLTSPTRFSSVELGPPPPANFRPNPRQLYSSPMQPGFSTPRPRSSTPRPRSSTAQPRSPSVPIPVPQTQPRSPSVPIPVPQSQPRSPSVPVPVPEPKLLIDSDQDEDEEEEEMDSVAMEVDAGGEDDVESDAGGEGDVESDVGGDDDVESNGDSREGGGAGSHDVDDAWSAPPIPDTDLSEGRDDASNRSTSPISTDDTSYLRRSFEQIRVGPVSEDDEGGTKEEVQAVKRWLKMFRAWALIQHGSHAGSVDDEISQAELWGYFRSEMRHSPPSYLAFQRVMEDQQSDKSRTSLKTLSLWVLKSIMASGGPWWTDELSTNSDEQRNMYNLQKLITELSEKL